MTSSYALALSEAEIARYVFMAGVARRLESDLWQRAGIVAGARVADVGCGPGAMFLPLSELVGPAGRIEAIDADPRAVAAARALVDSAGLPNVAVTLGRAQDTGLPAGEFDVVVLRHVLGHNASDEDAIVEHLATLLRPGGVLYLVDADALGVRTVPHHPDLGELEERYRAMHRLRGNDGLSGLRLGDLIERAGLELVDYQGRYTIGRLPSGVRPPAWAAREAMVQAGVATPEELTRWDQAFAALDAASHRPRIFVPLLVALGRRQD